MDVVEQGLGLDNVVAQGLRLDDVFKAAQPRNSGGFGAVYRAIEKETGHYKIVKEIKPGTTKAQGILNEFSLLNNVEHENIVKCLGLDFIRNTFYILLENVSQGSIATALLEYNQGFPEEIIRSYTRQILQGLHHLHMSNIAHRDIKGDNILIENEGVVKITDFGDAVQIPEGEDNVHVVDNENTIGTTLWNAPELYHSLDHGLPVDIWSLGCTVLEMYTGRNAWADICGNNGYKLRKQMKIGNTPSLPPQLSVEAHNFLQRCLIIDPSKRATAADLLQDPFVLAVPL